MLKRVTPFDRVLEIRELLADPAHWCKGPLAMDVDGHPADVHSEEACQWCMSGAFRKVLGVGLENPMPAYFRHDALRTKAEWKMATTLAQWLGFANPVDFNEHPKTTHGDVIKFLDRLARLLLAPVP